MAVLYKDAMKRFIDEITDACNQHEILYADMVFQDSLFDFQEQFIAALINAVLPLLSLRSSKRAPYRCNIAIAISCPDAHARIKHVVSLNL